MDVWRIGSASLYIIVSFRILSCTIVCILYCHISTCSMCTCNDTSLLNFSSLLSHFKSSNFILNTNCLHFSCLYSETTLMFMSTESEWLKWWYEVGILLQMTTRGPEVTSNWNWNSSVVTDDQQTQSTGTMKVEHVHYGHYYGPTNFKTSWLCFFFIIGLSCGARIFFIKGRGL